MTSSIPITQTSSQAIFIDTTPKRRGRKPKPKDGNPDMDIVVPELEEWDPRDLPPNFFIILEGKRRTGKSTFAKWLFQWYENEFSLVWVMSQTAVNGYWQPFVGSEFVFDGWRPNAIENLIQRNKSIVEEHGEESPISKMTGAALIILDDCITKDIFY